MTRQYMHGLRLMLCIGLFLTNEFAMAFNSKDNGMDPEHPCNINQHNKGCKTLGILIDDKDLSIKTAKNIISDIANHKNGWVKLRNKERISQIRYLDYPKKIEVSIYTSFRKINNYRTVVYELFNGAWKFKTVKAIRQCWINANYFQLYHQPLADKKFSKCTPENIVAVKVNRSYFPNKHWHWVKITGGACKGKTGWILSKYFKIKKELLSGSDIGIVGDNEPHQFAYCSHFSQEINTAKERKVEGAVKLQYLKLIERLVANINTNSTTSYVSIQQTPEMYERIYQLLVNDCKSNKSEALFDRISYLAAINKISEKE